MRIHKGTGRDEDHTRMMSAHMYQDWPHIRTIVHPSESCTRFFFLQDCKIGFLYRGVGQTRMMEIVKKPSGLPRPVRITPTVRITSIIPKTDFLLEISNYFFTKDLAQLPSLLLYLIRTLKLELGGLKLKKLQKYSEKQF